MTQIIVTATSINDTISLTSINSSINQSINRSFSEYHQMSAEKKQKKTLRVQVTTKCSGGQKGQKDQHLQLP